MSNSDILSQEDFCREWIEKHLEPQGDEHKLSLTWFVSAWVPFRAYVSHADRAGYQPIPLGKFGSLLVKVFPGVKGATMLGNPIFTGCRYYEDHIGGRLVMGV